MKVFLMVLCIALNALFITGCGKQDDNFISESRRSESYQSKVEQEETTNENKSIDISNYDNTEFAEAIKEMEFYGEKISFPCKFGDLSDSFNLQDGFYYSDAGYTFYNLTYNDKVVASIGIDGEKTDDNDDREVCMLMIEDDNLEKLFIRSNVCSTDADTYVSDILGEPYRKNTSDWKSSIEYYTESVSVSVIFNYDIAHKVTLVKED